MSERLTPEAEKLMRDEPVTYTEQMAITEIDALRAELAQYKTHDHAPCIFCDPLRSQVAEMSQKLRDAEGRAEQQRQDVIRLLQINNKEESIAGACNNRMQEVLTLRESIKEAEDRLARALSALREISNEVHPLGPTIAAQIAKKAVHDLEREAEGCSRCGAERGQKHTPECEAGCI